MRVVQLLIYDFIPSLRFDASNVAEQGLVLQSLAQN